MNNVNSKVVGVIHAYPSPALVNSLADDGWKIALVVPPHLAESPLVNHQAIIDTTFVDFSQASDVIKAACESHQRCPWTIVIPVNEGCVDICAAVAERLELAGNSVTAAETSRNKAKAYQAFNKANVSHPISLELHSKSQCESLAAELNYPMIVKLSSSMNSQGVIRVNDADEFLRETGQLFMLLQNNDSATPEEDRNAWAYIGKDACVVVQPFMDGVEINLDLLFNGDDVVVMGIFEKAPLTGPWFAELYSFAPTRLSESYQQQAIKLAIDAVKALGASIGAAHVEIRFKGDKPYVLEVGLRPGGGYTVESYEHLTGINIWKALATLLANGELPVIEQRKTTGILYGGTLFPRTGKLESIRGVDQVKALPQVLDYVQLADEGDNVFVMPESAQPHFAYYLLEDESADNVLALYNEIQQMIQLDIRSQV